MIVVFGSINVDLVCRTAHFPAPGETVAGSDYELIPGGKGANQALAARRAGAEVQMIGAVGEDDMAGIALRELAEGGVHLDAIQTIGRTTGVAIITVDQRAENTIVLSPGANGRLQASALEAISIGSRDTLLLQMEVPVAESLAAARRARAAGARIVLSIAPFAPLDSEVFDLVDIILVNETEARDLARHLGLESTGDAEEIVAILAGALNRIVVATLGAHGAIAVSGAETYQVPSLKITPVDTTGAGDTFCGVLATLLDEGQDLGTALSYASVAGSLTCLKLGAQPSFPTRSAIEAALDPPSFA